MHERSFSRAIAADMAENPSSLFALNRMARRSKQDVVDMILADIHREVSGYPGPVMFPHLRTAFRQAVQQRVGALGAGMGQAAATVGTQAGGDTTTTPTTTNVVGDILKTLIGVGGSIYVNKMSLDAQEDLFKRQEKTAAAEAAARAAQAEAAMRQQQAMMAQQQARVAAPSAGLPGWVLPAAGVAAAAVVAVVVLPKILGGRR